MIIFLSLKSFTVFFSVDLLTRYLKAFLLEIGEGLDEKEYERNGGWVVASVCVPLMGGGGHIFATFVRTY